MVRLIAILLLCACVGTIAGPRPAAAAPATYEYRVMHPTYGDIGSYTNVIDRSGGDVHVQTVARIKVTILGVTLYRETADRNEVWKNGRLVYFHAVTTKNGKRVEVEGQADGDRFVVNGPEGTVTAPANVQPPNLWSSDCLRSDAMLSSVTGKIYPAQVHDHGEEVVNVAGQQRKTRKYEIDTDRAHTVWFDDRGVPVILQTIEDGDPVQLVLARYPESVNLAAAPSTDVR
jgi:hypothetical protein